MIAISSAAREQRNDPVLIAPFSMSEKGIISLSTKCIMPKIPGCPPAFHHICSLQANVPCRLFLSSTLSMWIVGVFSLTL